MVLMYRLLAAMLLRAMQMSAGNDALEPRSLTVHFARAPKNEPFTIETTVERHDRYAVVETHDPAATAIAERTAPRPSAEG